MTTHVAVYARKSREQGGPEEARSVSRQVAGARAWIAERDWHLADEHVYVDEAVSGYLFRGRPAFQQMLGAAQGGAFEAVVLYDLDRFGRNSRKTMEALYALADVKVSVWDYRTGQRVDLNTFQGRITATLYAEFAQQEQERGRKRTYDALLAKVKRGEWAGRHWPGMLCLAGGRSM